MTCPHCQQVLSDEARFCSRCGFETMPANRETELNLTRNTNAGTPTDHLVGQVLDAKYEILARLGTGGAGTVYRARRLHIGDEVAVKILNQDYLLEHSAVERFRREARSAAMIRHTNVVTIHDFSESRSGQPAYIVMELVRGVSLRELLRKYGRLLPERAVVLMRDVCAGVGVAHRQGLVHRDLKPDNVIIVAPEFEGEREQAKVVDFGIAKLGDATAELNLTQTGALVGTPFYMSPEQWQGEQLDARSDVYSLGAMLYEMLSGTTPFAAATLPELIAKQLNHPPPRFAPSLNVPAALERVCLSALAKKREDRPADATALNRELQSALGRTDSGTPSSEAPTRSSPSTAAPTLRLAEPKRSSRTLNWAAIGIVALIIIAASAAAIVSVRNFVVNRRPTTTNSAASGSQNAPIDGDATKEGKARDNSDSGSDSALTSSTGLMGKWSGTYGPANTPATLLVQEYHDGKFRGVLEQGEVRVTIVGNINLQTRQVTMKETQVLKGSGWSLGENTGEITADGLKMSGTGKDAIGGQFGTSYTWSFSR